uniref:uncharacterized protein isoform X2 n=2 Tax=Pristiophorus japonicus TaxID=55135 RepID=UPI00398E6E2C
MGVSSPAASLQEPEQPRAARQGGSLPAGCGPHHRHSARHTRTCQARCARVSDERGMHIRSLPWDPAVSFSPQSSTAIRAGFESKESDTHTQQLKSDHQEQVSAVQKTDEAPELKVPPVLERTENLQDHCSNSETQDSVNFSLQASSVSGPDLEIVKDEKCDTLSSSQQIESDLQKLAGKVQDTTVISELKPASDVNGIASVEDQRVGSNTWASTSDHEGAHGRTEMVLHEDEERAKKLQNNQTDCGMEEIENCQPSEDSVDTSVKVTEEPELQENLFNEKIICEPAVAKETDANVKGCNHECIDGEEDLYRDEDEIEKEKSQRLLSENQLAAAIERSTIEPGMAILEYCTREWKGNTAKAQLMNKAYEAVCQTFSSLRRVRGDNYCALRATLFQALSNVELLPCLQQDDLVQRTEKLLAENYIWIEQWYFGVHGSGNENPVKKLKGYLTLLKQKWRHISKMDSLEERRAACEEVFKNDEEEYRLYEAMKIVMLAKAIELDGDKVQEKDVPLFCWLLFARDTSADPCQFMKNHLNHVGYTGGLDQVEMFLLGYSLQLTIRVFRLYKFGTDEFITFYPDDHKADWPMVTLITEDDRHYNVPVKDAQVTHL